MKYFYRRGKADKKNALTYCSCYSIVAAIPGEQSRENKKTWFMLELADQSALLRLRQRRFHEKEKGE
jgi:hypothetical protein